MGAQEARQFKLFNDFWILAIYCIYWYGLERAKCDLNDVKIAIFPAKSQKSRSSWGLGPLCNTLELQRFDHHGT